MTRSPSLLDTVVADRYQVERELGRGGMAIVYLARDSRHHRAVALKVLQPELALSIGVGRFLREIDIAAQLTHPHILPLFDSGTLLVDDHPSAVNSRPSTLLFFTMPYIAGGTVRDRIRREGQLPVADAVRIAHRVSEALAYAHAHGVVHRDIKPENILLAEGEPVVADFGIARALNVASDDLSLPGLTIGTPTYMSPEQLAGSDVDGRSDIYSLGCVLYEMLLGEPPFTGPSAQVMTARHRLETPRSVRLVRPTVPLRLQQLLDRSLAKLPADRFQSADDLADELDQIAGDSRVPILDGGRHTPQPMRSRYRLLGGGVLILAVLAVIALLVWPEPVLDRNRVVVFPLSETGGPAAGDLGQSVALLLGHALQHTDPLSWIDGWTLLNTSQRAAPTGVPASTERALARRAHARYYMDGAVVSGSDSVTVVLRLYDSQGDTLVRQVSRAAASSQASLSWPALGVLTQLLPSLLAPGRQLDSQVLLSLADRDPGALANWLQGDRAYREGHFDLALEYYQHALARDSTLALAALSAAQAAGWEARQEDAVALAELAQRHAGFPAGSVQRFCRSVCGLRQRQGGVGAGEHRARPGGGFTVGGRVGGARRDLLPSVAR